MKWIALASSGDLPPIKLTRPSTQYDPHDNDTGYYFVRFQQGGGNELAGVILPKNGSIWLVNVGNGSSTGVHYRSNHYAFKP
jgi:hypothetical protein